MKRHLQLAVILLMGCHVSSDVSRQLGARCQEHDECDELCLSSERFPGGMCTASCDSDGDCPAASLCVDIGAGVCLYPCENGAACEFLGEGWECLEEDQRPSGRVNVCIGSL